MIQSFGVKRSILLSTYYVNTHTQSFHLTSKAFARVLRKNRHNNAEEKHLEQTLSTFKNTNENFLGIESDQGVIDLNSNSHYVHEKSIASKQKEKKEKFCRTSFGVIRYDSENKLQFHGQYENRNDFTFPHSSTDKSEVSRKFTKDTSDSFDTANTNSNKNLNAKYSNLPVDETCFENNLIKESSVRSSSKDNNEASYIDQYYFSNFSEAKDNASQNISNSSCTDELNFLDKSYFGCVSKTSKRGYEKDLSKIKISSEQASIECTSENFSSVNKTDLDLFHNNSNSEIPKASSDIFTQVNSGSDETFISKIFSDESCSFNNDCLKENADKDFILKNIQEINSIDQYDFNNFSEERKTAVQNVCDSSSSDDLNFVEKNYFKEVVHTKCSPKNISATKIEEKFSRQPEFNSENIHGVLGSKRDVNELEDKNQVNDMKCYRYISRKQVGDEIVKSDSKSKNNTLNVGRKENNSIFENDNNMYEKLNISSHNIPTTKNFPVTLVRSSVDSNKYINIEDEYTNIEDVKTAYDFVKNLHKQEIPLQNFEKEGKKTSDMKFDSKGFRILKNQVDDLGCFTRDEIMSLLKRNIIYSDDNLLILNKPYNLVIHDSQTTKFPCLSTFLDELAKDIDQNNANPKLLTVHRLDKETTGCLLIARNEDMALKLQHLFAQRKIEKKYWILTSRVPDPPEGLIDIPIAEGSVRDKKRMVLNPKLPKDVEYRNHSKRGKQALTAYKVISESGNAALVEVTPITGIKHQIRVHFGFGLSCPVLGDHKYSHLEKLAPQKLPSDILQRLHVRQSKVRYIPLHIHAKSVTIPGYFEGRDLHVKAPLPKHMKENLRRLKFRK